MPSALEQAGSRSVKNSRFAPIHTNRFFTGLWTNRSALRDAATPYLYEKFYSGSRFESLIGGSNMELTSRLTLARRPGQSVYNSQSFPAVKRFFGFRISGTNSEAIKVLADTAAVLYDATGPNTKTAILNKAAGAGQSFFESVGNVLFIGDGAEEKKWVQSPLAWAAGATFKVGDFIVDSTGVLELVQGIMAPVTNVAIAGNILTLSIAQNFAVGANVQLSSLVNATFLNGVTVQIVSSTGTQITANLTHADYPSAADTGNAVCLSGSGTTSGALPNFAGSTLNNIIFDNQIVWQTKTSALQNFMFSAPGAPPQAANAPFASQYHAWVASTFYSPNLIIFDVLTNTLQKLTTGGITGGSVPVFSAVVGATTADNTAVWTCQGTAAWVLNHVYAAGALIAVTYSVTTVVSSGGGDNGDISPTFGGGQISHGGGGNFNQIVTTTYTDFFKCTQGGTSGAVQPTWQPGIGTTIADNSAIWTNIGTQVVWATIGAATKVSLDVSISDSNGNIQSVIVSGKSGALAPTWATAIGSPTVDGGATWNNGGPSGGAANTGAWVYAFAGINDVTGDIGTASGRSTAITQAANSLIQLQGQGFSDPQVGKIRIYRTQQGGTTLLKLADIINPGNVAWSYSDTNVDANLNKFIQAAENGANNPPPSGVINLVYHVGKLWGSVGNVTYYSAGATATEGGIYKSVTSWPTTNTFTWNSRVLRQVPTALGLMVFTTSGVNIVTGDGITTALRPNTYLPGIGLLSYNALATHGSIIYFMDSRKRVISLDPSSGVTHVGFPITDQFKALFDPATAYLTYHIEDGTDEGLYVSDGSTGWFRLNPTPAPESGMSWSPKATIVGGCQAVQTMEVSSGVHHLLVGPTANGPILLRDSTVFQDNGSNYADCFAIIGSLVLAQSGTVAQLEFIAQEMPRIGSRPKISVRLNEIGGNFYTLPVHVNDPPYLAASGTLYSDRWYFAATQKPAYCKHMQIQFSFPAENVQNELLTYSIFGAILKEK